jgi:predicted O-methyltransferase YrrM
MKPHDKHNAKELHLHDSHFAYPSQDKDEFEQLCQLVRDARPHAMMEVGSRHGRSLLRLAEAGMPTLRRVLSVDLPEAAWGKTGSGSALQDCAAHLASRGLDVQLLLADSHGPEAKALAEKERDSLDFLFLDGDHTYEGLKKDFLWFSPCVRRGGIVAFHDVCAPDGLHSKGKEMGVPRFWHEIREAYPEQTRVFQGPGSILGIGILVIA